MWLWETLWNISKVLVGLATLAAVIAIAAKMWSLTAKDNLIDILKEELKVARDHSDACDKTTLHYRNEMHEVRNKAEASIRTAQVSFEDSQARLKMVEIENATLKAKTDLSPVMETMTKFIQEQTLINSKILQALERLAEHMAPTT